VGNEVSLCSEALREHQRDSDTAAAFCPSEGQCLLFDLSFDSSFLLSVLSFYLSVILSACLFVCLSLFFVSLLPLNKGWEI
jgi:hypothetical protein